MNSFQQNVIKHKFGLLNLAVELGVRTLSLGISIMKTQLSNQQSITLNAINHAMLVCYAAGPET